MAEEKQTRSIVVASFKQATWSADRRSLEDSPEGRAKSTALTQDAIAGKQRVSPWISKVTEVYSLTKGRAGEVGGLEGASRWTTWRSPLATQAGETGHDNDDDESDEDDNDNDDSNK
ncbi:hypothetical protein KCU81_g855, partial [Aureobasidium melanogenum]